MSLDTVKSGLSTEAGAVSDNAPSVSGRVRPIFRVGGAAYFWEDLVLAAHLWGEWADRKRELCAGLSCLKWLECQEDEEETLPRAELETAAANFRYARDLVSAEEMEAWLADRGLSVEEWTNYLRRILLVRKLSDVLEVITAAHPIPQEEVAAAIPCDLFCGDHAKGLALRLASRAAIYSRGCEEAQGGERAPSGEAFPSISVPNATPDLEADTNLLPERCRERLDLLATLDAAWDAFRRRQATPEAIRAQVEAHRLEWIRLRVRRLTLPTIDAALEAALCIREDGMAMAEVAATAGGHVTECDWVLEDIEPELRGVLLGGQSGELLGPFPLPEGFALVSLLTKQLPSEDDPVIRLRAEQSLVAGIAAREIGARVTWHLLL
jgi:hypothetical protein